MTEEKPAHKSRSRASSHDNAATQGRSQRRSRSRSSSSSPGTSPKKMVFRKPSHSLRSPVATTDMASFSTSVLEQSIAAIRAQHSNRHISISYTQDPNGQSPGAVITLSRTNSPALGENRRCLARLEPDSPASRGNRRPPPRRSSSIGETTSPKTREHHDHQPLLTRQSSQGSQSSNMSSPRESLTNGCTSKTALLRAKRKPLHSWKKKSTSFDDDYEVPDCRWRPAIEMALAAFMMLLGTGAIIAAFMTGRHGHTWTILGSTSMGLGILLLVLGVCCSLAKTREGLQDERIEMRVVNAKQMAQLVKRGFTVTPVQAV